MAKMKVHELAKELERQSKELVAFLQDKGYEVKAAQSSIDEEAVALVRKQFGGGSQDAVKAAEVKSEKAAVVSDREAVVKAAEPEKTVSGAAPKAEKKAETAPKTEAGGSFKGKNRDERSPVKRGW